MRRTRHSEGVGVGGDICVLIFTGGNVVKICVQWFLFVVTALSCLYAALHGGRATFTARDAVEQSLSHYRLTRPPVSLCLNYNSPYNSNNLSTFQKK